MLFRSTSVKNSLISIGSDGILSGAGGGTVTAAGISAVQTSLGNAPSGILNSSISIASNGTLSGAGGGQVTLSGVGFTGDTNATYGAIAGTNLKDSGGTVLADSAVKNSAISISSGGVLSGGGGGTVTAAGISAVQTSLANAPAGILNSSISISSAGVLSGGGGGTADFANYFPTGDWGNLTDPTYAGLSYELVRVEYDCRDEPITPVGYDLEVDLGYLA